MEIGRTLLQAMKLMVHSPSPGCASPPITHTLTHKRSSVIGDHRGRSFCVRRTSVEMTSLFFSSLPPVALEDTRIVSLALVCALLFATCSS
eukprot:2246679-Pleurochrysis_carterae.AAC.1